MSRGKGTSESESRKRRRGTTARPPKGLETLEVRMKLVKSLLLGSAAGLFAVAGAQAADLPVKKAAPVDYVRVCSTYGTGYWFLPGTDICLRISGYMRADYLYVEPGRSDFDATGFRARGRLNFDFRQPTEYGLLRAFIRYEVTRNTGVFLGSGQSVLRIDPVLRSRRRQHGRHPARLRSVRRLHGRSRPVVLRLLGQRRHLHDAARRVRPQDADPRLHGDVRLGLVGDDRDRRSERAQVAG